jgi:tRNA-dihydrouridine synthase 4
MSARGILANPALFLGYNTTPPECVFDWISTFADYGSITQEIFQRLLMFMSHDLLAKWGKP